MTTDLQPLELVPPGRLRDRLIDAVLDGVKTATSRLAIMDTIAEEPPPQAGMRLRLVDSAGSTVAVVELTEVRTVPLGGVGDDVARAEGDWFTDASEWRVAHELFWGRQLDGIRRHTGDPEWSIDDDTPVVVRFFRLIGSA